VIALDSRGHGDSDRAEENSYKFDDYVSDLDALLGHLSLEAPILIGHSAGGRYCYAFASRNPGVVRALVVVDIDPDSHNKSSLKMFERYFSEDDNWPSLAAVVERLRTRQPLSSESLLSYQAEVMTRMVHSEGDSKRQWKRHRLLLGCYERPDLWEDWKRISCPTVIIRGRQSDLLTHETGVKMRENLSGSLLVELEGGGHWVYQESPSVFESAVRLFIEGLP
jgi:pimeloyl-ACP methyl ester carboxylesterase